MGGWWICEVQVWWLERETFTLENAEAVLSLAA